MNRKSRTETHASGRRPARRRRWTGAGISLAFVTGLGCASVPPPREEVAQAREKVKTAQTEQAGQFAPLALRKAQDDLSSAEDALRAERNAEARRKAEMAKAQADLALAETEKAQKQQAVEELTRTVQALESELRDATDEELAK